MSGFSNTVYVGYIIDVIPEVPGNGKFFIIWQEEPPIITI